MKYNNLRPQNRQITFTDGVTTASYTYYPSGLRKNKTVNGETLNFIWDGTLMVYEFGEDETTGNKFTYGHFPIKKNSQYYSYNAHGDVVQLVEDGEIVRSYDYDAFGNELNPDSNDTNPLRYCGEYFDKETGTVYLRARYYNPTVGRFSTIDPARDGLNWYAYCSNNPIVFVDPWGLEPTALQAACMADHIYNYADGDNNTVVLIGGWEYVDYIPGGSGMIMGIYSKTHSDGTIEYALVNKGTSALADWDDNISQPFGYSSDMKASIEKSMEFVNDHQGKEITFIGHSKGGAEAAANAVANNGKAIIFNPANANFNEYGLTYSPNIADIEVYIVEGEILNNLSPVLGIPGGNIHYLPKQNYNYTLISLPNASIKNHSMSAVKSALLEVMFYGNRR